MHLKRSLFSYPLCSTGIRTLTNKCFQCIIFQFLRNRGKIYISNKYLHNSCPTSDFILNLWFKWTTHWVLYNLCTILSCFISNLKQRSYLNLHASACFSTEQYQLLHQWEQNTSQVKLYVQNYKRTHTHFKLVHL